MTITPDTKDWTWVLRRACPECRFDAQARPREEIAQLLRSNASAWPALLAADEVRRRPDPARWSPLEYACHVRDVFLIYDKRLALMLTQDDPLFPNWDQDATAVQERYAEQDPAQVGPALVAAGGRLADSFDQVTGEQWQRPGRRSDGAAFTVETIARYLSHDPVHHLYDVTGVAAT